MADDKENQGNYSPSKKSKAAYRKDSADLDYANDTYKRTGRIASGPTPKRYYDNFDRGAKRYAAKQAAKKGSKK